MTVWTSCSALLHGHDVPIVHVGLPDFGVVELVSDGLYVGASLDRELRRVFAAKLGSEIWDHIGTASDELLKSSHVRFSSTHHVGFELVTELISVSDEPALGGDLGLDEIGRLGNGFIEKIAGLVAMNR